MKINQLQEAGDSSFFLLFFCGIKGYFKKGKSLTFFFPYLPLLYWIGGMRHSTGMFQAKCGIAHFQHKRNIKKKKENEESGAKERVYLSPTSCLEGRGGASAGQVLYPLRFICVFFFLTLL